MTTLVVFTTISKLLVTVVTREIRKTADDVLIVDLDDSVHMALKELRLSSFPIRAGGYKDWAERDVDFKKHFMPGEQLDFNLPTTELAAWKMISLDRFSFWYRGKVASTEYARILEMRWDKAIVPCDMNHPIPWTLARYSGKPVIGVKVSSFRTREWWDALQAKAVPFDSLIVDSPSDKDFLIANGYGGEIEVYA